MSGLYNGYDQSYRTWP